MRVFEFQQRNVGWKSGVESFKFSGQRRHVKFWNQPNAKNDRFQDSHDTSEKSEHSIEENHNELVVEKKTPELFLNNFQERIWQIIFL